VILDFSPIGVVKSLYIKVHSYNTIEIRIMVVRVVELIATRN